MNPLEDLYKDAIQAHRNGKHEIAIKHFTQILQDDPQNGKVLYNLANVYADIGHFEDAIENYEESLLYDIKPSILFNLANSYAQVGELEKAIGYYNQSITMKQDYVEAYFNKAVTLTDLGKYEEAINTYKLILEIDPSHDLTWYNLACIQARLLNEKAFLESLERAIRLNNSFKKLAENDDDFEKYSKMSEFKNLVK